MSKPKPDCIVIGINDFDDMRERIRLLSDIALSALALKMNIEHGFLPALDALNRDLAAFERRFGHIQIEGAKDDIAQRD